SGVISGRRAATANALCAAVVAMLVCDPAAVDDVGLQLSALATAGLVIAQAPLSDRLGAWPPVLRAGVATTLAATLPTLPVVAGAFGRLSGIARGGRGRYPFRRSPCGRSGSRAGASPPCSRWRSRRLRPSRSGRRRRACASSLSTSVRETPIWWRSPAHTRSSTADPTRPA